GELAEPLVLRELADERVQYRPVHDNGRNTRFRRGSWYSGSRVRGTLTPGRAGRSHRAWAGRTATWRSSATTSSTRCTGPAFRRDAFGAASRLERGRAPRRRGRC